MTMMELSEELMTLGHGDIFDGDIYDIIDIDSMSGSFYDIEGDCVVEFKVINLKKSEGCLYTLVEII